MVFYNQGVRLNYIFFIDFIRMQFCKVDMDKIYVYFVGEVIMFLFEICEEDFNVLCILWQKVFDELVCECFINNVFGKMVMCKKDEVIKCQIVIFCEVDDDIVICFEKVIGIKGYDGIFNFMFNGIYNGMMKDVKV